MFLTIDDTEAIAYAAWTMHTRADRCPLGSGQFGQVYRVPHGRATFAVKVLPLGRLQGINSFEIERQVAQRLPVHASLVPTLGTLAVAAAEVNAGFVVMAYASPLTLSDFAADGGAYDTHAVLAAVAAGVAALHAARVAHRDIKADNISIDPDTRAVRLFDFGLAEVCQRDRRARSTKMRGSPLFMPPEMLDAEWPVCDPYAQDVWALGQLLYFLETRADFFSYCRSLSQLRCEVGGPRLHRDAAVKIRAPLRALFHCMTAHDRERRPSAAEVCAHLESVSAAGKENAARALNVTSSL